MTRHITLVQINDTHGYIEPHQELFWAPGGPRYAEAGGYARLASYLAHVRGERPDAVIALDNGDTIHGTYPAVQSRGEALVPLLNALAFDAMTAHWDFAYGPEQLQRIVAQLSYPLLAINCYEAGSERLAFPPTRIVERGGIRVGIVGIAATIVDKTMPKHFSTGLRFTLGLDELPGHIGALRAQGAELIVVLSHLGFPQDARVASLVDGIDVILSGHTHNRMYEPARVGGAWIIQSGCHGSFAGRLDLRIDDSGPHVESHTLAPMDESVPLDPRMLELVELAVEPSRALLDEVVGETTVALDRNFVFESTMDNLLLDAIADAAGLDMAFSNGWRYGAPVVPGPIRRRDLWDIIAPNPPVSVVELTGAELRDMMEENLERTFACDPFAQMGGFVKRCRGITLTVRLENPPGLRIQRFFVGDALLEAERRYVAAYVTSQGVPDKYGRNRRDLPVCAVDALAAYLAHSSPVAPLLRGAVSVT